MSTKFPRAYDSDVKKDESMMIYVPTDKMDIGARPSGLPNGNLNEIKSLEHVGKEVRGTAKKI
jgi:hypothetical protein